MLIEYRTTKHRREVPDGIGQRLVDGRIATKVMDADAPKQKRKYKRRDMRAED